MTYSPNRSQGQWAAHGRYLARESAIHGTSLDGQGGFGPTGAVSNISSVLRSWQTAGDPRLFKLIISPEFGDQCDLHVLTRDLLSRMEVDLGTRLQWVATAHYNTEHPHVHVALRGLTDRGEPLRLPKEYIRHGIRTHAENLTTRQIGYRTILDADEAERREIEQSRYTSLDRMISRSDAAAGTSRTNFPIDLKKLPASTRQQHLKSRLMFLEKMDLAEACGSNQWLVRSDFQVILEGMQSAADRQQALAHHRAILSDTRLPIQLTDAKGLTAPLEGRVLGHIEDERTGGTYMILEGTNQKVHFICHTTEIESARRQRKLQPNAFIRIRPHSAHGKTLLILADLGKADELLNNAEYMRNSAQTLLKRGIVPVESGWGGWLGQYEARLVHAFEEIKDGRLHGSSQRQSHGQEFCR